MIVTTANKFLRIFPCMWCSKFHDQKTGIKLNRIVEQNLPELCNGNREHKPFVILREKHLNYLVDEYVDFYNNYRPHSSVGYLPSCRDGPIPVEGKIRCQKRLGGLLKHYHREAAWLKTGYVNRISENWVQVVRMRSSCKKQLSLYRINRYSWTSLHLLACFIFLDFHDLRWT